MTNSYRVGEWKASRQKEIQILLATLKEYLEIANSAYIIRSSGDFTRHTTVPVALPGAIFTAPDSVVAVGGMFEPNTSNDFFNRVEDVNSISFFLIEDGDKRALKIVVECVLLNNSLPASNFTESTVAKLMRDTMVTPAAM